MTGPDRGGVPRRRGRNARRAAQIVANGSARIACATISACISSTSGMNREDSGGSMGCCISCPPPRGLYLLLEKRGDELLRPGPHSTPRPGGSGHRLAAGKVVVEDRVQLFGEPTIEKANIALLVVRERSIVEV